MLPVIEQFMKLYPDAKVLMSLDNKQPNLRTGHFDISILVSDMIDPGVVARKITETNLCLFASPKYLEEHGNPDSVEVLKSHRCLHYLDTPHGEDWIFQDNGVTRKIPVDWHMASNNGRALCEAASLGMGIVRAPRFSASRYLDEGQLVEVLPAHSKPVIPVFATYLQRRFYPAKLSVFIQFLLDYFNQAGVTMHSKS